MKLLNENHVTSVIEDPKAREDVSPCMETFKVKITFEGRLDKGKTRICVRGDIQKKTLTEDTWSPVSYFRLLKAFTSHCVQLDHVGAFLQALVRGRIYVKLPSNYAMVCPYYAHYCGWPLRLIKTMYGMGISGIFGFQECMEWLVLKNVGFRQSEVYRNPIRSLHHYLYKYRIRRRTNFLMTIRIFGRNISRCTEQSFNFYRRCCFRNSFQCRTNRPYF